MSTSQFFRDDEPGYPYNVDDFGIVLHLEGFGFFTISKINGDMCVNPLGHQPDATVFGDYAEAWFDTHLQGLQFVGTAFWDANEKTYRISRIQDPLA